MRMSPSALLATALLLATAGCKGGKDDLSYGDDAAFEGMGLGVDNAAGAMGAPSAPHDPNEPAVFSAGWVGMEAYQVLQSARRGELATGQTRIGTGEPCLVFHDNRLVRRMIIGTGKVDEPTREITFSAAGRMVLWFYSNRAPQPSYSWAYFHDNTRLALFQQKHPGSARETTTPPGILPDEAWAHANDCLTRFKATNPMAGVGNAAATTPQPPQPVSQPQPVAQPQPGSIGASGQRSVNSTLPVKAKFINWRTDDLHVVWIDTQGVEKPYGKIPANHNIDMNTYVGHLWVFRSAATGQEVTRFSATSQAPVNLDIR